MNPPEADSVIRISKEEATSSHVDDLLKRQMSMRGEPGVTRGHERKWYYQTWFVLMLVGTLGAVAAWGLIEPYFADMLYLQGPISAINPEDELIGNLGKDERAFELRNSVSGSITIKGEKIYLLRGTREIIPEGGRRRLDFSAFHVGDIVGVYSEYFRNLDGSFALAFFVDRSPKPQSPGRAKLTLEQSHGRAQAAGMLLFAVVAGFIGLFIGAADGIICRLPRRALLCGFVGLIVGIVGGFVCSLAANVAYAPLTHLAQKTSEASSTLSTFGFLIQMFGRSLAWCLAGIAMGLGQGIALRSTFFVAATRSPRTAVEGRWSATDTKFPGNCGIGPHFG